MFLAAEEVEVKGVVARLIEVADDMGASPVDLQVIRVNCQLRWVLLLQLLAEPFPLNDHRLAYAMMEPDDFLSREAEKAERRRRNLSAN